MISVHGENMNMNIAFSNSGENTINNLQNLMSWFNSATPKTPTLGRNNKGFGQNPHGKNLKIFLETIVIAQFLIKFGSHIVKPSRKLRIY